MTSSDDERSEVSYPAPVWPWLLVMWLVVGLLFIGPSLEVQSTIGGATGTLSNSWDDIFDTLRDLGWFLFNIIVLVPLAVVVTIVAIKSHRRKVLAAQEAEAEAAAKAKKRQKKGGKKGGSKKKAPGLRRDHSV